ncbi:MAG: hypothetical protein LBI90_05030 [Treponema sp.]|nr:hypothetical protein [Treponema sp.]
MNINPLNCEYNHIICYYNNTSPEGSQTFPIAADSQEFGRIRPAYFASLDKMDMVITDTNIEDSWVKIMEDMGITVEVV